MKRPIKFRGKRLDGGDVIYGDFVHTVPMSSFPGIIDDEDKIHAVSPDTVAQLVGFDRDGKEVYEGDIVIGFDCEIAAELVTNPVLKNFKLKEKQS